MSGSKRYVANRVVSCREEDGTNVLLYNPDTDTPVLLNATGRAIWSLLAAPHDLEEIAIHLTEVYQGVTLSQARQEAADFLQELEPDFVVEASDA